jgi:glutamate synthase (NADPH/NADH) small chain
MPEREPILRAQCFVQVNLGLTPEQAMFEASRCIQCKEPACVPGCPVGIDIKTFLRQTAGGDFLSAARTLKEANCLPAICGRVCPQEHQCEGACILRKKFEPVAIGHLERFVADFERDQGAATLPPRPRPTGKRVAIVGSGPSGLATAGDLVRFGHEVTAFEALHAPGGVLLYGIPEFRLPKAILQAEVGFLEKMGVEIDTNVVIGRTVTIDELLAGGYQAAFIGTGAGFPNLLGVPGENLNGVYSANEFLTRANLMMGYRFPEYDTPVPRAKRVAVVGGGDTAMDAVRTAKRLGAEAATIVYRRSMAEMPARAEEVRHAQEEGIEFRVLTAPLRLVGDGRGWVAGLECQQMTLGEPDASGRRRPVPVAGATFTLEVDCVVVAIGTRVNPIIPATTPGLRLDEQGYIAADPETGMTSRRGIFAGGDIVRGGATVILAMGDGRRAAAAIDRYLRS